MGYSRSIPLLLGALAVASGLAMLSINIIFSVALSHQDAPSATKIAAIVASGVGVVALSLSALLLGRYFRYRNGAHVQDIGRGPQHTYLIVGMGAMFCVLSAVATAVGLGMMIARTNNLPEHLVGASIRHLIAGAFIVWAIGLVSQGVFLISMIMMQRKDLQQGGGFHLDSPRTSEMKTPSRSRSRSERSFEDRGGDSTDSSRLSRTRTSTMTSMRSSLSAVGGPMSSKARFEKSARPTSTDSGYRDTMVSEDGFDSWDTSAVDPHSRQAVLDSGPPTPSRVPLETIPASPTTSRSASPGFPLDLEPPKTCRRSRSYSPAGSFTEKTRDTRTSSPVPSLSEAHIHPLFRTDSPEPPPAVTPGTIITAAASAGQVLSSRSSVRSLRMRSGSLPPSPLIHSDSLDSIRRAMEREDREPEDSGAERTLTPPIPDWVMGAGPRSSIAGYNSRRKIQIGLGKVGEAQEG